MDKKRERPSWDEYFVNLAIEATKRSSCLKRHVGAIIIDNNQILTTGYNGAPRGVESCYDHNICWRRARDITHGKDKDLCMAAHAEFNAICQAARRGIALDGSILYVTTYPCPTCAKAVIQSGIKEVRYLRSYYGEQYDFSRKLLRTAGIKTKKMAADLEKIKRENPDLKLG